MEETIRAWGAWGVFGSIGLMILHSFVPFPAEILAIANGMVYGPLLGTVITWVGAMLGAFLAFGLARTLGRPFVGMMVARKNWYVLDEWTATRGGRLVLVSRFFRSSRSTWLTTRPDWHVSPGGRFPGRRGSASCL